LMFFVIMPLFALLSGHTTAQSATQMRSFDELVKSFDACGTSGIYEAGRSGDVRFIPYLKRFLDKSEIQTAKITQCSKPQAARLALAKLGDKSSLQQLQCEAYFGPTFAQYSAINQSNYVGGWASIQMLAGFLDEKPHPTDPFNYQRFYGSPGDEVYAPAQFQVLQVLPKIVPNAPFTAPNVYWAQHAEDTLQRSRLWRDWIAHNKENLSKLLPSAEVDASQQTCKQVLKKDQFILHKRYKPST
jgi:hypothetical protein